MENFCTMITTLVFINKIITNIFYNNERKLVTDSAFKDDVAAFKNNK